jgi:hypothetical protein
VSDLAIALTLQFVRLLVDVNDWLEHIDHTSELDLNQLAVVLEQGVAEESGWVHLLH